MALGRLLFHLLVSKESKLILDGFVKREYEP